MSVDPSTSALSNVFDTYVQQGTTVDWSNDVELDLGDPGTKNADGTYRTARSFVSWNTAPISDALVMDAKLSLWNFHSANYTGSACPNQPWEVWSTGAASTSSRWTAQPSWTAEKATSSETRGNPSCATQPDGWINANLTTTVQEWASAKAATNPPKPVVTYNYRPRTGTKQEAGPPYFSYSGAYVVNTTTPTLRDTFVDPNGDKVQGAHQIFDSVTDTQVEAVLRSAFVPSGQPAPLVTPAGVLVNGKTYKFRSSPYDGTHYNLGWPEWKTFTVDTAAPSAPTGIATALRDRRRAADRVPLAGDALDNLHFAIVAAGRSRFLRVLAHPTKQPTASGISRNPTNSPKRSPEPTRTPPVNRGRAPCRDSTWPNRTLRPTPRPGIPRG